MAHMKPNKGNELLPYKNQIDRDNFADKTADLERKLGSDDLANH